MSRGLQFTFLELLLAFLGASVACAHVGSPHVVFEGHAGSFPVRVLIRQPDVVPGLADISVQVLGGTPERVSVLPLHSNTGKAGAPRPDQAQPVAGETNLFTAALWFMTRGAYGVQVEVDGPGGGTVVVPVNSIAYERKPLPPGLGRGLAGLGILLAAGVIGIAAAAAQEATLPSGVGPGRSRRRWSWVAGVVALVGVSFALSGGALWWNAEDTYHERRVLYRQLSNVLEVAPGPQGAELTFRITDSRDGEGSYRLVPDHGKLIHLFLMGETPDGGLPPFAHVHPVRRGAHEYVTTLPALPADRYRVFADLTHESGFTQTLTNTLVLATPVAAPAQPSDDADSAALGVGQAMNPFALGGGLIMTLTPDQAIAGKVTTLRARIVRSDGSPAVLQPYLRMLGHAVVMREDGSVFAHVHPAGTLSLAAARTFATKLSGEAGARASDENCGDLEAIPPESAAALGRSGEVSFPYVFPKPGAYFLWIQVKIEGRICTGSFRVRVGDGLLAWR